MTRRSGCEGVGWHGRTASSLRKHGFEGEPPPGPGNNARMTDRTESIDLHPDHRSPVLDRRELLRAGTLLGASAALLGLPGVASARRQGLAQTPSLPPGRRAKNLIFMASDGMSTGTLTLADMHRRRTLDRPSAWCSLWSRPGVYRGTARTHSLNSLVTDSAAAGSAWGCGVQINNGAINVGPDGTQLMPLLIPAMQAGRKTGLVTTTRITHATPAAFIANVPRRDMEDIIAQQMLERRVDVLLGGGDRHFPAELLAAHPDLRVVRNAGQLETAAAVPPQGRLLGLFARSHVPYVLDRMPWVPSLASMSRAALARLEASPEGFVLQIEGGRIDHAAHSNDAAALVKEQLDFDDAIAAVLDWLDAGGEAGGGARARDTLLIVTSDHGNANPGLTIYNQAADKAMANLDRAAGSFERIEKAMESAGSPEAAVAGLSASVAEVVGRELSDKELEWVAGPLLGRPAFPFSGLRSWSSALGSVLADDLGVSFISGNHTADQVEVTAMGPGSDSVVGCIDNTRLHAVAMNALGLSEGRPLPGMDEKFRAGRAPAND